MLRSVVAIVTGGASGLGAATASQIVRRGGKCIIADLPRAKDNFHRLAVASCAEVHGVDVVADGLSCESNGSKHDIKGPLMGFAECDVRKEEDIKNALDLAEESFGEPVNLVVNCAGIAPARRTIYQEKAGPEVHVHSLADFSEAMEINTIGTFNMARLGAERMVKRDVDAEGLRGCIINTASIAAFEGQVGQVAYAASKGAVVGMTLPLARDLAPHGIRVMTIAPGLFRTPLLDDIPKKVQDSLSSIVPCPKRFGHPEEYGRLVVSIVTNPMLNGEVIRLDGALRMPA